MTNKVTWSLWLLLAQRAHSPFIGLFGTVWVSLPFKNWRQVKPVFKRWVQYRLRSDRYCRGLSRGYPCRYRLQLHQSTDSNAAKEMEKFSLLLEHC